MDAVALQLNDMISGISDLVNNGAELEGPGEDTTDEDLLLDQEALPLPAEELSAPVASTSAVKLEPEVTNLSKPNGAKRKRSPSPPAKPNKSKTNAAPKTQPSAKPLSASKPQRPPASDGKPVVGNALS